jgi:predicted RNA-binding Zn-ribbon protein involved in translation (DUF1610 family)
MHACEGANAGVHFDFCTGQPVHKYLVTEQFGIIPSVRYTSYLCPDCWEELVACFGTPDNGNGFWLHTERCDVTLKVA